MNSFKATEFISKGLYKYRIQSCNQINYKN